MRNSSSLDWLRFMHTPNDYRVSHGLVCSVMENIQKRRGNLTFVRSVFQGLRNAISPRTNNAESPRRYVQHPQPLFVFQSEARMYIDTHQEDVFIAVHLSGGSKIAKF